jgi:hypothetical protein
VLKPGAVRAPHFYHPWTLALLLLVIALGTRTYRAFTAPVVNPDAIRFIDQGQLILQHPLLAVRSDVYHPLHALAGALVHDGVTRWLMADDRMAWIAALQTVGVVCGAVLSPLIFSLSRRFGAPSWAAAGAGLLFAVGKRTSWYGADGLSDMLFMVMFVGALLVAVRVRLRPQVGAWGIVGLLAGLAYLTRPEGAAVVLILIVGTIVTLILRRDISMPMVRKYAVAFSVMVLGFLIVALPYMVAIGRFTGKKTIFEQESHSASVNAPVVALRGGGAVGSIGLTPTLATLTDPAGDSVIYPVYKVSREVWETLGFGPCLIVLLAMLIRPRPWGRAFWRPLATIWIVFWLGVMVWLLHRTRSAAYPEGYLDGRHTLPLIVMLHVLFALSLGIWMQPMRWWQGFWRRRAAWAKLPAWMRWTGWPGVMAAVVWVLAVLPGVTLLPYPETRDKAYIREAANWVRAHTSRDTVVADVTREVGYYAGRPYVGWLGDAGDPRLGSLPSDRPVVVAKMYETTASADHPAQEIAPSIGPFVAAPVRFASTTATQGDVLVLYARPGVLR